MWQQRVQGCEFRDKEKTVEDTKSILLEISKERKLRWLIKDSDKPS